MAAGTRTVKRASRRTCFRLPAALRSNDASPTWKPCPVLHEESQPGMCGLCGLYAPGGVDAGVLQRMNDTLVHRGPDDAGFYIDERTGLGSRRLSIIDLSTGHMPIHNEDQSVWVVQNGEIYNYLELRQELEAQGHRFETRTDTEVLAHLYEEAGARMFERLRGMFAVAVWDRKRGILLLGRDRVGKKPLYYHWDGKRLAFGSEIKAIRELPGLSLSLDPAALNAYFSYLYVPDPLSIFREIRKLPAAHYLELRDGKIDIQPYWDLRFDAVETETDEGFYVERLRELLTDAVRVRLMSDVPLGAFLSGGVDSATVVGIMSQLSSTPVQTFSIGFDDESFDELKYARIAARAFGPITTKRSSSRAPPTCSRSWCTISTSRSAIRRRCRRSWCRRWRAAT
jgi:asparagine synthase (glutamine-hydrolysing)